MELLSIFKPEYFFQPKVALLRLLPFKTKLQSEFVEKVLPWGIKLRLRPSEEHGQILLTLGVDEIFPSPSKIDILKLDVEDHELTVLKGAEKLITQGSIRDCVFEDHREYPTPVTQYFEDNGYKVFRIQRSLFKPLLLSPDSEVPKTKWLPTSFLATKDATRAMERFQKAGWQVLKKN